jgi:hypothetical protein
MLQACYEGRLLRYGSSAAVERGGKVLLLAQGEWIPLIAANYSPYPKRFYERVKVRRGAGKAFIALAWTFLSIIYRMLKNKWVFEGFPNFVPAEGA